MPAPTVEQLRAELQNDPANLGYAEPLLTAQDRTVAGLLNASRDQVYSYAPIADLQAELHKMIHSSGLPTWSVIKQQAAGEASAIQAVCQLIIDITQARYNNADMGLVVVQASLSALETATILTTEQKNTLLALGQRYRSRAEELWGLDTRITAEQVSAAR
jgi:hypothetical protein